MAMKITRTNNPIYFGFSTLISKLWKEGKLPEVTKGIYGGELSIANITNEHILPKSKGGKAHLSNIALATLENNNKRANGFLSDVLTAENFKNYCKQFKDLAVPYTDKNKVKYFYGNKYIKDITETVSRILREEKRMDIII